MARKWERDWCLCAGVLDEDELASWVPLAELDRLILSGGLGPPDLQLITNGRAVDAPRTRSLAPATDTDFLLDSVRRGGSFRVQHLENYLPSVGAVCRQFESDFGYPVRANAYFAPPDSSGLAPHFDTSEAFIVQILGEKHWKLYDEYTHEVKMPLPDERFDARRHRAISEGKAILLRKGDILYLPRGVMHAAFTTGTASIHVTFSLLGAAWVDVLGSLLRRAAADEPSLRRLIPPGALARDRYEDLAATASRLIARVPIQLLLPEMLQVMEEQLLRHKGSAPHGTLLDLWKQADLQADQSKRPAPEYISRAK